MAIVPMALKHRHLSENGNLAKVIHGVNMEPKVLTVVRECHLRPSLSELGRDPRILTGIVQKAAHKHRCCKR